MNSKKTGVILVGHGSREPYNKDAIQYFAERLKSMYEYVGYAFMEMSKPTIQEALQAAAASGLTEVIIQPVFLTRGVHIDFDIPELLGIPRGSRSGMVTVSGKALSVKYGGPIGKDDRILEILIDRIREAAGESR
ncbi:MAG: sirohydrochlorin nickelochelatase [Candidatus Methanosuratincola sp.]|jgi:sirohydrochlorin cobaltochelatase|nr:sirohydrochlorin nickelochelatase [Candidatus Methanosuratincola sp.]